MRENFEVLNIRCEGCSNTIKRELKSRFNSVEIDLKKMPRIVTVDIQNSEDREFLKSTLRKLGYPLNGDNINFIESSKLKVKSFASCAVGKFTK